MPRTTNQSRRRTRQSNRRRRMRRPRVESLETRKLLAADGISFGYCPVDPAAEDSTVSAAFTSEAVAELSMAEVANDIVQISEGIADPEQAAGSGEFTSEGASDPEAPGDSSDQPTSEGISDPEQTITATEEHTSEGASDPEAPENSSEEPTGGGSDTQ